jgi:hypothetical protein
MAQKKKKAKKKTQKKAKIMLGPVAAGWCEDFTAAPGQPVDFTPPANATINQSGSYWPFCGANDTKLGPPINFNVLNQQIYIKSNAPSSPPSIPFDPEPCGQEIHTVTVT